MIFPPRQSYGQAWRYFFEAVIFEPGKLHRGLRLGNRCAAQTGCDKRQSGMHGSDLDKVRGLDLMPLQIIPKQAACTALVIMAWIPDKSFFVNAAD